MRHLYPFLFRSFSLWERKEAIRGPSDVEIREEPTKRSAFRCLREQSTPQCHNAAFSRATFARCFGTPRQKCPPPKRKPEEAQLSVGFFLEG